MKRIPWRGLVPALLLHPALLLFAQPGPPVPPVDRAGFEEPNPFIAFLPAEAQPDWTYWKAEMLRRARLRSLDRRVTPPPAAIFDERESPAERGLNDHPLFAEPISSLGTQPSLDGAVRVRGALLPPPRSIPSLGEPNGSLPEAPTLLVTTGERVTTAERIGDGPYGSAGSGSGDLDLFAVEGRALQRLEVLATASGPGLDAVVALFDAGGNLLALGEDLVRNGFFVSTDAELSFELPLDGIYYIGVGGQEEFAFPMSDPFDAASGTGVHSEGDYELLVALDIARWADVDTFAVELRAGDVLGAVVDTGPLRLSLHAPTSGGEPQELLVGSAADLSALYPASSLLPGGGEAAFAYQVESGGSYLVSVAAPHPFLDGRYELELVVGRSPLVNGVEGTRQVLFLDFDGELVDRGMLLGGPPDEVFLSPLADFLSRWGFATDDESELVTRIVATVEEKLSEDVRLFGSNGDFRTSGLPGDFVVEIRNSRDHEDPGADPHTSRIVVGGTVDELRLMTVAIAEGVDPGNFEARQVGVVLLDLLSEEAENPNSLNGVDLAAGRSRLDLVGRALGTLAAHEAGHLFGNFHTRRDGGPPTVMDRGGSLAVLLGIGADEIWGTNDDVDVDLGPDQYEPLEVFDGLEKTLEAVSFGLPAAGSRAELAASPQVLDFGTVPVGSTGAGTVVLTNPGSAPLDLEQASIGGPQADAFSIEAPLPSQLPPGSRVDLPVSFRPLSAGPSAAELTLLSHSAGIPDTPVQLARLVGQGDSAAVVLDRDVHDFGALEYGPASISSSAAFRLRNFGPAAMEISGSVVLGSHSDLFTIDSGGGSRRLASGSSHLIRVSYRPRGVVGAASARLAVRTNLTETRELEVQLTGRADGPDVVLSPIPFFFGFVEVTRSRGRPLELRNRGTRPLRIDPLSWTGGEVVTSSSAVGPFVVEPAGRQRVDFLFTPVRAGPHESLLTIRSSDPDESLLELPLEGFGFRPRAEVDPPGWSFGPTSVGTVRRGTLTITNPDLVKGLRVAPSIEGDSVFSLEDGANLFLLPNQSRELVLLFEPTEVDRSYSAELVLDTNDPLEPQARLPITGRGVLSVPATGFLGLLALASALAALGWSLLRD